jgi:hypothetical protein
MAEISEETRVSTPICHSEEDKAIHEEASAASVEAFSVNAAAAALNGDQSKALKIHNDGRKAKGCPALTWDSGLAQHAQEWANHLAKIDKMEHSSGDKRPGEGENLAWWVSLPFRCSKHLNHSVTSMLMPGWQVLQLSSEPPLRWGPDVDERGQGLPRRAYRTRKL